METVRTLVVDDELPARTRVLNLLRGRSGIDVIGAACDGHEAVARIRDDRPHLLFLDIEMPGLNGFGVLRAVAPVAPASIFVTAYDRYAIAAFEAHALDYLLKPFSDERFESALRRAVLSIRTQPDRDRQLQIEGVVEEHSAVNAGSGYLDRIVLKEHGRIVLLNVHDIDWISAAGVYLELHAGAATHLHRSSLAGLLPRLDPARFVRIHRSLVVNTDRIKELRARGHSDYTVVLRDDRLIPLSRAYRSQLEGWLRQRL
jgi:two-component system, LytTR family, response regulator